MSPVSGSRREALRVVLVGWGAIGRTVARLLGDAPVEIVAVARRDWTSGRSELPTTARPITSPRELEATTPDVVAEAAGRDSVEPWGRAAAAAGADFIVSSVSAFADPAVLESLRDVARRNGVQIHIQPGALAGIDALAAARATGIDTVVHRIVKPPVAWRDTPAEDLCSLDDLAAPVAFFTATAAETATRFPKNANVAMTTALAGVGADDTTITLVADPTATTNRHELVARGSFGELEVTVSNNPLPDNARTSAMAALGLVRAIENRASTIVI